MGRPRSAKGRARETALRLTEAYPAEAPAELCELDHRDPYELLVATILSAQATDAGVNRVTPSLFARFPDARSQAGASEEEVQELIGSLPMFRNKSRSLIRCATELVERHDGKVPGAMADLVALSGVGRKTANLVRCVALGLPGLPVDTHVLRVSKRLALTEEEDPVDVEMALNPMVPVAERGPLGLRLILHGRRVCAARRPRCVDCVLSDFCPSAQ